ncbi:hypothetical protein PP175_29320 (plasmid) [Aneurinibacillus sp. Ricciae_BoGa-3]|uniref:hypothetical protein n=1 Tax=Aneurinibacillus sp. Ricciae_BoGa-3 TaxID=3022697 RepID=UPI00233FBAB2|nr:hypothetical protein [Aneurinibacillus sp. Ricciae_BoGa-3]WCK57293.1 hypothetical protein PP175_29320 [Aneurinibacillus sp. Ricciae_BoGa-3]
MNLGNKPQGIYFEQALQHFYKQHQIEKIVTDFDFNHQCKVYIGSGQMFNEFGRLGLEMIADICEAINLDYYLPQHNTGINKKDADFLITNEMIVDDDNKEVESCNMLFSHFTIPEDSGLSAECGRFGYMRSQFPQRYICSVAILDDIRKLSKPNPLQEGKDNQVIYMNSYTAGIPDYFGNTLYDCFAFMYKSLQEQELKE